MEAGALNHTAAVLPGLSGRSPLLRLKSDDHLIEITRQGQHGAFDAHCNRFATHSIHVLNIPLPPQRVPTFSVGRCESMGELASLAEQGKAAAAAEVLLKGLRPHGFTLEHS